MIALLVGTLLVATGFAQVQSPGKYYQVRGVIEFSGEMIVRPIQTEALQKMGVPPAVQSAIQVRARQRLKGIVEEYVPETDEYVVRIPRGYNENTYSLMMSKTGDYEYVTPNFTCYPLANPNDPLYAQQWHHPRVSSPLAWNLVTGSPTVTVGVVDTGIDLTHEDLAPNRVPGYNSVDRLAEVDGGQVNDLNGHGTHVAGDAAAFGNNGKGVSGMGWNFKVMMVRTSNDSGGGASLADLTDGARWAADHGCKSVSVSYSGVDSPSIGTTGTYCKNVANANLLWAAGNDNRDLSGFSHPDTIVVGASDQNDQKAGFSAYGRGVHVFAPGVNILSTTLGGGYGGSSGTSMAAPVANGACGLIWAANPGLTAAEVQTILEQNCDQIGDPAIFGFGRINQFKNVSAAQAANPIDEQPISISIYEGTYMGGTLADILNPNAGGPSYNVRSVSAGRQGLAAGVIVTYDLDTTRTNLRTIEYTFQTKAAPSTLVTGFVYLWNYDTNGWELANQFPVVSNWTMASKKFSVNAKRFMHSSGEVKVLMRALSATSRGRLAPSPFILNIGYAHLQYTEGN